MRSYIRSLWVSVVCAVVLSGAPGIAVAHEVNPSSGSSVTTPSLMAMMTPGAVSVTSAAACNSADQYAECIGLTPSHGPAGAQVTVNGTGWIDHANRGLDVPINIGMAEVARAHPKTDGTFRVGMTIPTSTPEGEVEIDAIIGNGGSATARYTVTGGGASSSQAHPSVTLSPSNGPPKTVTTADGHGFIPNQSVTVTQSGGPGITGGGVTVQADQSGSINMSFRISDQTPSGVITVKFAQGANTATAQFRVTTSQTGQSGNGGPNQDTLPQPGQPSNPSQGGTGSSSLRLPFPTGTRVHIGSFGLHGDNFPNMTDSRTGTRYTFTSNTDPDSLDVVLDPPTTGTATVPATALTSGKVLAVWNDCQLALVDHGNGLWAVYLHLRDIKVISGQVVAPGDPLGFPTTILPPVRPCGNVQSDAEHVHFALLKGAGTSGTYVSMQSLCGYQVTELLTRINKPFTVPAC